MSWRQSLAQCCFSEIFARGGLYLPDPAGIISGATPTHTLTGHCPEATMDKTHPLRIAAIDPDTGWIWGETENLPANQPTLGLLKNAAWQISRQADPHRPCDPSEFVECSQRDAAACYHLYEIADDVEIYDGQDAATIAAVESGRYLGSVRRIDRVES